MSKKAEKKPRERAEEPPTLWQKLSAELAATDDPGSSAPGLPLSNDSVVVVCGRKKSGKTSALERFTSKDKGPGDVPKPTIGVSYNYARDGQPKVVANIYEVGVNLPRHDVGDVGAAAASMLSVPINADTVLRTHVVVALSLAEPGLALSTLESWLRLARVAVDRAMKDLENAGPSGARRVEEHLEARRAAFAEHKDAASVSPFPVPLVIMATMWDAIEPVEGEQRKWLLRALRFCAHLHGATLLCMSTKNEGSLNMMRSVFGASFLAKAPKKDVKPQLNHLMPVLVRPGEDSFEGIGNANGQQPSEQTWASVLREIFPPPPDDANEPVRVGDRVLVRNRHESEHEWRAAEVVELSGIPGRPPRVRVDGQEQATQWELCVKDDENAKFAEPLIDSMAEQKREELVAYRKEKERAQRLASSGLRTAQA